MINEAMKQDTTLPEYRSRHESDYQKIWELQKKIQYLENHDEGRLSELRDACQELAEIHEGLGDSKAADSARKKAMAYNEVASRPNTSSTAISFSSAVSLSRPGSRVAKEEAKKSRKELKQGAQQKVAWAEANAFIASIESMSLKKREALERKLVRDAENIKKQIKVVYEEYVRGSIQEDDESMVSAPRVGTAGSAASVNTLQSSSKPGTALKLAESGEGESETFVFWYDEALGKVESVLSEHKHYSQSFLKQQVEKDKTDFMTATQKHLDEQTDTSLAELEMPLLVDRFHEMENRMMHWQLECQKQVQAASERMLAEWKDTAKDQKQVEADVLLQQARLQQLAMGEDEDPADVQLTLSRHGSPEKPQPTAPAGSSTSTSVMSPSNDAGGGVGGGRTVAFSMNRLQQAFAQAIPELSHKNSEEVVKLQRKVERWRSEALKQVEDEAEVQRKHWQSQIEAQEDAEGKIAVINAIERERQRVKRQILTQAAEYDLLGIDWEQDGDNRPKTMQDSLYRARYKLQRGRFTEVRDILEKVLESTTESLWQKQGRREKTESRANSPDRRSRSRTPSPSKQERGSESPSHTSGRSLSPSKKVGGEENAGESKGEEPVDEEKKSEPEPEIASQAELVPLKIVQAESRLLLAEWHRSFAQYETARIYYERALHRIDEMLNGKKQADSEEMLPVGPLLISPQTHLKVSTLRMEVLVGLADLSRNICNYVDAKAALIAAEKLRVSIAGRDLLKKDADGMGPARDFQLATAELHSCQAAFHYVKSEYKEAEAGYNASLSLRRTLLGSEHHKVASCLAHLGKIALLKCDYQRAQRLLGEASAMRERVLPASHPALASSYHDRGILALRLGQFTEARNLLEKARVLYNKALRRDMKLDPGSNSVIDPDAQREQTAAAIADTKHPSVALVLCALGELNSVMGLPKAAISNFVAASEIVHELFGDENESPDVHHTLLVDILTNQGVVLMRRGFWEEADESFARALQMHVAMLPHDKHGDLINKHLVTHKLKLHLADSSLKLHKINRSRQLLAQAGQDVVASLGKNHTLVIDGLLVFGRLLCFTGNYTDAHLLLTRCLMMRQELFGNDNPYLSEVQLALAENFLRPGYFLDAIDVEAKGMSLAVHIYESNSLIIAEGLFLRAQIIRDSRMQMPQAEALYQQALALVQQNCGTKSARYAEMLGEYSEYLRLSGKPEEAESGLKIALDTLKVRLAESAAEREKIARLSQEVDGADDGIANATLAAQPKHLSVAQMLMHQAWLLLDDARHLEAKVLLEQDILPLTAEVVGMSHPFYLYVKACIAHASIGVNGPLSPTTMERQHEDLEVETPHDIIDEVLEKLEEYEGGKSAFAEDHPWVLALGGYLDPNQTSTENSVVSGVGPSSSRGGSGRRPKQTGPVESELRPSTTDVSGIVNWFQDVSNGRSPAKAVTGAREDEDDLDSDDDASIVWGQQEAIKQMSEVEAAQSYRLLEEKFLREEETALKRKKDSDRRLTERALTVEEEMIKLQLQRQQEIDSELRRQKEHWLDQQKEAELRRIRKEEEELMRKKQREIEAKERAELEAKAAEYERFMKMEEEWANVQAVMEQQKIALREQQEAAEVALQVQHRTQDLVKEKVDKRADEKKLKKNKKASLKHHKAAHKNYFGDAEKERKRVERQREKAAIIELVKNKEIPLFPFQSKMGEKIAFSSLEKEEAYVSLMKMMPGFNKSVLSPDKMNLATTLTADKKKIKESGLEELSQITTETALRSIPAKDGYLPGDVPSGAPSANDNILLKSPLKLPAEDKSRYGIFTGLETGVDRVWKYSKKGRMKPITVTPKENAEVSHVINKRDVGPLQDMLEQKRAQRIGTIEDIYTEEQPKLILGQRHGDGGSPSHSRPGSQKRDRGSIKSSKTGSPRSRSRTPSPSRTSSRPTTHEGKRGEFGGTVGDDGDEEGSIMGLLGAGAQMMGLSQGSEGSASGSYANSRASSRASSRPNITYERPGTGSSRLITREGKYMLENKLPEDRMPQSASAGLYGDGALSPSAYPHIPQQDGAVGIVGVDIPEEYLEEQTIGSLGSLPFAAGGDSSVVAAIVNQQQLAPTKTSALRDDDGWKVMFAEREQLAEEGRQMILRDRLRRRKKRAKIKQVQYKCDYPGCGCVFTQSWYLTNHCNQKHGNDIVHKSFRSKPRIPADQVIKRYDHQRKVLAKGKQSTLPQIINNPYSHHNPNTMFEKNTMDSTMGYAHNDVGTEAKSKTLKDMRKQAAHTTGGIIKDDRSVHISNISHHNSLVASGRHTLVNFRTSAQHLSDTTLTHPENRVGMAAAAVARASNTSREESARLTLNAVTSHEYSEPLGSGPILEEDQRTLQMEEELEKIRQVRERDDRKKRASKQESLLAQMDVDVIRQSKKWEEQQQLQRWAAHTEELKQWRRGLVAMMGRQAKPMPKGTLGRRTKDKYLPKTDIK